MKVVTITRKLEAEKMFLSDKQARYIYDLREKSKRDLFSSIATAKERGIAEGMEIAYKNIVISTFKKGLSANDISNMTGIPLDFVNKIKNEYK